MKRFLYLMSISIIGLSFFGAKAVKYVGKPKKIEYNPADLKKALATHSCPNCMLKGAPLPGFRCNGGNFAGADLSGAILNMADLSHCKLPGADLSGAQLIHAKLHFADLTGAKLDDAWLDGAAGLKKAKGANTKNAHGAESPWLEGSCGKKCVTKAAKGNSTLSKSS